MANSTSLNDQIAIQGGSVFLIPSGSGTVNATTQSIKGQIYISASSNNNHGTSSLSLLTPQNLNFDYTQSLLLTGSLNHFASASFTFAESASNVTTITLSGLKQSQEVVTLVYRATSSLIIDPGELEGNGSGSSTFINEFDNGDVLNTGEICFVTGSNATEAAENLEEAINSAHGHNSGSHGSIFTVSSSQGSIFMISAQRGSGAHTNILTSSLSASGVVPATFDGGAASMNRQMSANFWFSGYDSIYKVWYHSSSINAAGVKLSSTYEPFTGPAGDQTATMNILAPSASYIYQPSMVLTQSFGISILTGSSNNNHSYSTPGYYSIPVQILHEDSGSQIAEKTVLALNAHVRGSIYFTASISGSAVEGNGAGVPTGNTDIFVITDALGGLQQFTGSAVTASGFSVLDALTISGYGAFNGKVSRGKPLNISASLKVGLDPNDPHSAFITGSGNTPLYFSGSGKIGIGTTDPIEELDFRADNFQIQSNSKRRGLRINDEGNIESFSADASQAATGSEFVLSYNRGTPVTNAMMIAVGAGDFETDSNAIANFATRTPEEQTKILFLGEQKGFATQTLAGDVLGSIRWIAASGSLVSSNSPFNKRTSGEACSIQGIVNAADLTGVSADMTFNLASRGDGATQVLRLDAGGYHELTGSLNIGANLIVKGDITSVGDDLTVTDDLIVNGDVTVNGANLKGDNATSIDDFLNLTILGNATLGNGLNDEHTINGTVNVIGPSVKMVGNITSSSDISSSGHITALSASIDKLQITDINIIGRRHILWQSPVYINDNPLIVDTGYFGSSAGNTPSNWNDLTADAYDSGNGVLYDQVNISEDQYGSLCFFAPFAVSRLEILSSWRTAGTGDDEGFWCGVWTGSAGQRVGDTDGQHASNYFIGLVTGSLSTFANGGNWEGHNNDIDFTFSKALPAFTQIFYGHGTSETSNVGTKQTRGHLTIMVYEA